MIDLNKIPKGLTKFLINIFPFPFWIISIYLFSNELYRTEGFLIMGSLCVSLTTISFFLFSVVIFDSESIEHEGILSENIIMASVLIQSLMLSAVIFVLYLLKIIFDINISFFIFLCIYFRILILINIVNEIRRKKKIIVKIDVNTLGFHF